MTGEVIKSFLVGLGFGVDEDSLSKFNKAIASAGVRVTALYASIKIAAAGIFWSISKISEGFEQMGYEYRIIAPAISKALILRRELLSAYAAAGINIKKVVLQSVEFNHSLAKTKFILEAIHKSVGAKFLPMLTKQMDIFRAKVYANLPKIQAILERVVTFIFKAFEATTILGSRIWSILGRVWEFLVKLDEATNGWSTKILLAVAAWKLLNLAFLASPLGMILTGLLAILALYDDFMTFKEGGESLIDWNKLMPVIDQMSKAVGSFVEVLQSMFDVIFGIVDAVQKLISGDFAGYFQAARDAGASLLTMLTNLWSMIKNFASGAGMLGGIIGSKLGSIFGDGAAPNLNNAMQPAPLMPQGGGVNQKVSQETNIMVQGSADAGATGKAVASEQGKVNFDLTRNLKTAAQ